MDTTTIEKPRTREARERLPFVFYERPRCPECESPHLKAYKTIDGLDGSISRYSTCQDCGERFVLVLE